MKKKLLSIFLVVAMVLSLVSTVGISAGAEDIVTDDISEEDTYLEDIHTEDMDFEKNYSKDTGIKSIDDIEANTLSEDANSVQIEGLYSADDQKWYDEAVEGVGTTVANPYIISNTAELEYLAALVDNGTQTFSGKYIKLSDSFNDTTALTSTIGRFDYDTRTYYYFEGTFNGNNKTVVLNIYNYTTFCIGMFGAVREGSIYSLNLTGSVEGYGEVGGVCGYALLSSISNCTNAGTVKGYSESFGGICGYAYYSDISNCTFTASVAGKSNVGGIAGYESNSDISTCNNTGTVNATVNFAGGIAGYAKLGSIKKNSNSGSITCAGGQCHPIYGNSLGASKSENINTGEIIVNCYDQYTQSDYVGYKLFDSGNYNGNLDVTGLVNEAWRLVTYNNGGIKFDSRVSGGNAPAVKKDVSFAQEGKLVKYTVTLTNSDSSNVTVTPSFYADTVINCEDYSINDVANGILTMKADGIVFFAFSDDTSVALKPITYNDYLSLNPPNETIVKQEPSDLSSGSNQGNYDSAFVVYWDEDTIPAGESKSYTVFFGMMEEGQFDIGELKNDVSDPSGPHIHDENTFETPISNETELLRLLNEGGSGYLTSDVTLSDDVDIPSKVTAKLCLNRHILDMNRKSISIASDSELEFYDCGTSGIIKNGYSDKMAPFDVYGTLVLYSGTIIDCVGQSGGAVCVRDSDDVNGKFDMYGGAIKNCSANRGGAVYCYGEGSSRINMYAGSISGCKAYVGGAVDCSSGSFHMYGGSLSGNTAISGTDYESEDGQSGLGGAVYNARSDQSFHMHGGEITGNTAAFYGGAVFNNADVSFDGKCIVKDNYSYHGLDTTVAAYRLRDNVFTTVPIVIGNEKGETTVTKGSEIGITLAKISDEEELEEEETVSFETRISGCIATESTKAEAKCFNSDVDAYYVLCDKASGELKLVSRIVVQPTAGNDYEVEVNTEGLSGQPTYQWKQSAEGSDVVLSDTDSQLTGGVIGNTYYCTVTYPDASKEDSQEVTVPANHTHDGITFNITLDSSFAGGELATGNYYLTEDIDLSQGIGKSDIVIPGGATVNLCLNGHILKGTGNECVIVVDQNGTLNLYNCSKTTHKFKSSTEGPWVPDESEGDMQITGGAITGGFYVAQGTGHGGGIGNLGTFNMYGGNIVGNKVQAVSEKSAMGGGVLNYGQFTMYGGRISGNYVYGQTGSDKDNSGGGVMNASGGSFTMINGTISYNIATGEGGACDGFGGGVGNEGQFLMEGGTISDNSASAGGAGVMVGTGTFTMKEGTICRNTSPSSGGGVCNYGTINLEDGSINNNTSYYGGGIYTGLGNLYMTGGDISENEAYVGGAIYATAVAGRSTKLTGGSINNNESNYNGAVIIAGNSTTVGGDIKIINNTIKNTEVAANLFLNTNCTITVQTGFSGTIGVNLYSITGNVSTECDADFSQHFISDNESCYAGSKENNVVYLFYPVAENVDTGIKYPNVQKAIDSVGVGTELEPAYGSIKMLGDSTEDDVVSAGQDISLDMNGQMLTGTGNGSVIVNNGTLTITDTKKSSHKWVPNSSTEDSIPDGMWELNDSAASGYYTTKGGVISGGIGYDTILRRGGAIYNTGNLMVSNVNIIGNRAITGGGIYNTGKLSIKDGTVISGNTSTSGYPSAGVYAKKSTDSKVELTGKVIIKDNLSNGKNGNLCLSNGQIAEAYLMKSASNIYVSILNDSDALITGTFAEGDNAKLGFFTPDNEIYSKKFTETDSETKNGDLELYIDAVETNTYYASLTLNDSIDINFSMKDIAKDGFDIDELDIFVDGVEIASELIKYDDSGTKGVVNTVLAKKTASNMGKSVSVDVCYEDVIIKHFDYSVKKYCTTVLGLEKATSVSEYSALGKLCYAVLNYGAWAQKQFGNDTENLVNAGYENPDIAKTQITGAVADTGFIPTDTISAASASMGLGSSITLNLILTSSEVLKKDDFKITNNLGQIVDAKNYELEAGENNTYKIMIKNISASKLSRSYTISGSGISFTYSPYTYCASVQNMKDEKITETLQTLCKAIYLYGEAAKAYNDSIKTN